MMDGVRTTQIRALVFVLRTEISSTYRIYFVPPQRMTKIISHVFDNGLFFDSRLLLFFEKGTPLHDSSDSA